MPIRLLSLVVMLSLGGCGVQDCLFGIAHRDCAGPGSSVVAFPQDDAICRGYGLVPGTHDYDVCRAKKRRVQALTGQSTDYGALQEPLGPNVR